MEQQFRARPRDQATEQIECYILQNDLAPHSKLPSERDMCSMWQMNRTTLRSAIRRLIVEGKVYHRKGAGTFVAPPKLERTLQDVKSFTDQVLQNYRSMQTRPLDVRTAAAPRSVERKLGLAEQSPVFQLRRLRCINGQPVTIEANYLDSAICPGIEQHDFSDESFCNVLAHYGITVDHGHQTIGITYATEGESELLEVPVGAPLFYVSGISFDSQNRPIEVFKSVTRADKIRFSSILTTQPKEKVEQL